MSAQPQRAAPSAGVSPQRIALIYAVVASAWIALSDWVVTWVVQDAQAAGWISTFKGWLFVAVTALMLLGLTRRLVRQEQAHQRQLQATLDALPDLLFETDHEGRIYQYHSHRSDLLAAPPDVFLGRRFAEVVPTAVAQVCQQAIDQAASQGFSSGLSYVLPLEQGDRWFELSVARVQSGSDAAQRFILIARDITERHQAQEKLRLTAGVFSHTREGIVIADVGGTILDVNEAFTRITGYARTDVVGRNPRILRSGRQDAAFYRALWDSLLGQGYWSGEIWNRRRNGEVYPQLLTISAVRNPQGRTEQYVGLFTDITQLKEQQYQLEHLAHFDSLTGLPNRLLLSDRLRQAMRQAQRRNQQLAVIYLDLDGFKGVNDRHGHDMGDHLLVALGQRMKDALRDGDTLARIGGDEFVAVLIDLDHNSGSFPVLERLLAAASEAVHHQGAVLQVSASLGVTFYPQASEVDADQLLRQADQAMYQAKVGGKNRYVVFAPSSHSG